MHLSKIVINLFLNKKSYAREMDYLIEKLVFLIKL